MAFPVQVRNFRQFGPEPLGDEYFVEARPCVGAKTEKSIEYDIQISTSSAVWLEMTVVEALVPKGRLDRWMLSDRYSFIKEFQFIPEISLSRPEGDATVLERSEFDRNDWLPGTLERIYDVSGDAIEKQQAIAVKEHISRQTATHPRSVGFEGNIGWSPGTPLNRFQIEVSTEAAETRVVNRTPPTLEMSKIRDAWRRTTGIADWPVEHIYMSLVSRFLRRFHVTDWEATREIAGTPVVYLANHQVGIESIIFIIACGAAQSRPILTIAKTEHRRTWLGKLAALCAEYPGVRLPEPMIYCDREDPESMLDLIRVAGRVIQAKGQSLMVHTEGTRSISCGKPVAHVSSVLIDMAVHGRLPIVPIRFVGGLPLEPLSERIEFPIEFARQDIYLGSPILPEVLEDLASSERRLLILDAMNATGPAIETERPNAPDPEFEEAVQSIERRLGLERNRAVVLQSMVEYSDAKSYAEEIIELVTARNPMSAGDRDEIKWLTRFISWLREVE